MKIGVLVSSYKVSTFTLKIIASLKQKPGMNLDIIVCHGVASTIRMSKLQAFLWKAFLKLDRRLSTTKGAYFATGLLNESEHSILHTNWEAQGARIFIDSKGAELIEAQDYEYLFRCNDGILDGKILEIPKYGILSFHASDIQKYRGSGSGFWEAYCKEPFLTTTLQILTQELDGGIIVSERSAKTRANYSDNLYTLMNLSIDILDDLEFQNDQLPGKFLITDWIIRRMPDSFTIIKLMMRHLIRLLVFKFKLKEEKWVVRIGSYTSRDGGIVLKKPEWFVKPKKGQFVADPYLLEVNNSIFLFVEEYIDGKGVISLYTRECDGDFKYSGCVIEEPFHLSNPCVCAFNGRIFIIPESSSNKDLRIYEFDYDTVSCSLIREFPTDIKLIDPCPFIIGEEVFLVANASNYPGSQISTTIFFYRLDLEKGNIQFINKISNKSEYLRIGGGVHNSSKGMFISLQGWNYDSYGDFVQLRRLYYSEGEFCIGEILSNQRFLESSHHISFSDNYFVVDSQN